MVPSHVIVCLAVLLSLLFVVITIEGRIYCYRRLKKKSQCGGFLKKENYVDAGACCSAKGEGYADKKVKLGRNRFKCTPCSQITEEIPVREPWQEQTNKPSVLDSVPDITLDLTSTHPVPSDNTTLWPTPGRRDDFQVNPNLPPPRDDQGQLIVWEQWSPCSVSCGAGWRSRAKVCDQCDRNDYENVQSQPCMLNFYCPVDGNWGPWYPWESCSSTCNRGERSRHRKCNYPPPAYGGELCAGEGFAVQECNNRPCPVDGGWSEWTEYTECSSSCGAGISKRTRYCDSPVPLHGGKDCLGLDMQTKKCETVKCPVDGEWSPWSAWSRCSITCGRGVRERSRSCENPKPLNNGRDCEGSSSEHDECFGGRPCPIDGGWSEWSNYGYCRAARCSSGHQVRTRLCSKPSPAHGGKPCAGPQYERASCFNDQDCLKNGSWCEWSDWNTCTTTCRHNSLQGRHRLCACPSPRNGGLNCQGDSLEVRRCEHFPECPVPDPTQIPETTERNNVETTHVSNKFTKDEEITGDMIREEEAVG